MNAGSMLALFGAMVVLAAVPGVSVMTVTARSVTSGFLYGAWTTMGIVAGDIVFILAAILGLAVLAEAMGDLFVLVKYAGGAYLVWLGISLWRSAAATPKAGNRAPSSLSSSFLAGLLITLGDQKAIVFYLGFLPAFLDLARLTFVDAGVVVAIAIVAVGGVKLGYAYLAATAGSRISGGAARGMNRIAGVAMIAVGAYLVARA